MTLGNVCCLWYFEFPFVRETWKAINTYQLKVETDILECCDVILFCVYCEYYLLLECAKSELKEIVSCMQLKVLACKTCEFPVEWIR